MTTFFIILAAISGLILGGYSLLSIHEKEPRAARISGLMGLGLAVFFLIFAYLPLYFQQDLALILGVGLLVLIGLFILPVGRVERENEDPGARIDERDIMFARAWLDPYGANYKSYYAMRPEKKALDDEIRALPGLMSPKSAFANPVLFSATDGSFSLTTALRDAVDGPVAKKTLQFQESDVNAYIKNLARYYGALDVGIADVDPNHFYSYIGRGAGKYGDAIDVTHPYAIAFTVEMAHEMISTGPQAAAGMESARQYVESARVSVQLAAAIRLMGYEARAHIDGNYRVVAPLVARDAGLGEIGRMGLLITPRLGPRVRLGVVTTNLPLVADGRKPDPSVLDFCAICKKCAACCPGKSISFDDRKEIDGVLRWQINSEACFRYWCVAGTDCGRCMAVCPYSHPDNLAHNLVRWGILHSGSFRRLAVKMDDLFYGRKPAPRSLPEWTRVKTL